MNYGRYFRLNQALSKVVDGVAIYDYIDLPAYFGPSVDNPMSPKYPISVTVTSETVCFRLHYSAFKIEKKSLDKVNKLRLNENEKRRILDSDFPQYAYNEDDINNKTLPKINNEGLTDVGMAHMEEVILELPYTDNISSCLSDTIKDIYSSTFPQVVDENISMGGRFLEQLIRKRYPSKDFRTGENGIERHLYDELRKVMDDMVSYSRLWLMDLYKGGRVDLYKEIKDENSSKSKEIIIGFLRKLLLDFMFDLKHSDVFQNSANYQRMFSGLMSDFYFSALMHKCEYYYYRKLTREAIDEIENGSLDKETKKQRKESIKVLYANELVKAEDLWVQDIMNPQAEKDFEHRYPGKYKFLRDMWETLRREIVEEYSFKQWPSWFAEPEEEMRRICFTMQEESGRKHICNADTLIEYFNINNCKDDISEFLVATNNRNRELISRWFLKRYDFNDVIHLHFFKYLNIFIVLCIVSVLLLWLFRLIRFNDLNYLNEIFLDKNIYFVIIGILAIICTPIIYSKWNNASKEDIIIRKRRATVFKRTYILFSFLSIYTICIGLFNTKIGKEWRELGEWAPIWIFILLSVLYYVLINIPKLGLPALHPISSLHLLFPRLVAAITAGWLTMSLGFDIYVSFFDSAPRWHTAIVISVVVFMFIMYEINRIMPASNNFRKFLRSFEFLIISYCISLLVGVVVINFLGEKFLERGGYIGDYYDQHVQQDDNGNSYVVDTIAYHVNTNKEVLNDSQWVSYGKAIINRLNDIKNPNDIPNIKKVDNLQKITKDGHKIVEKKTIFGYKIFFMRDFLIMFSFIAMFWGIFIQMIFTGEKQMTEL